MAKKYFEKVEKNFYSSRNVFFFVGIFGAIFWLIYLIAAAVHRDFKIKKEIAAIELQNEKWENLRAEKLRKLRYLQTDERVEKEAKILLKKSRPGEKKITFIDEKLEILPPMREMKKSEIAAEKISIPQKWQWIFFRKK